MVKQLPKRQRIRKGMVILAFLSFPVTMNFLSPYVIVDGAMKRMDNCPKNAIRDIIKSGK